MFTCLKNINCIVSVYDDSTVTILSDPSLVDLIHNRLTAEGFTVRHTDDNSVTVARKPGLLARKTIQLRSI